MKISHLAVLALASALHLSPAFADEAAIAAIQGFHNNEFRPIVGMAANPENNTAAYRGGSGNTGAYTCANTAAGGGRVIRYPFTVPDARDLQFVRIWGFKSTGTADTTLRVRRSCMTQAQVDPTTDILGSVNITSTDGAFSAFLNLANELPNNLNCRFWAEIEFGSSATACASGTQDLRIDRVRVHSLLRERIFRGTFRSYTP
ncbi:MAG: hypothetical protein KF823_08285 [Xanthomonadales bacterium]|nr:hypothetical protein [Xanthomonadales bacterium]